MTKRKVLVIDSDDAFADLVVQSLRPHDIDVFKTGNGNEGLDMLAKERPNLIFLQVELPRLSGFSLCNKIKKLPGLSQIPLILVSAEATQEAFQQHMSTPTRADDYVSKPIAQAVLMQKVTRFLGPVGAGAAPGGPPPLAPPPMARPGGAAGAPPSPPGAPRAAPPPPAATKVLPLGAEWRGRTPFEGLFSAPRESGPSLSAGAGLEEKIEYFRDRVKRMEADAARFREAWQTREKEITELEDIYNNFRARLQQTSEELTTTKDNLAKKSQELDDVNRSSQEQLQTARDLEQGLREQIGSLEQHNQEISTALTEATGNYEKQRQENADLRTEMDKQVRELTDDGAQLRQQITDNTQQWTTQRGELEHQLLDANQTIQQKDGELHERHEEIAKLRRFRAAFDQNTDFIMGVFEKSGAIVGGTGIHPRVGPGGLEIGYWIAADRTRRGYATELAAALTRVAFEVAKVRFLEIRTARSNAVSARIPKKLGFVHEATLPRRLELVSGAFDDADIFTMHADAYEGSPARATPISAFDAGGRQVLG